MDSCSKRREFAPNEFLLMKPVLKLSIGDTAADEGLLDNDTRHLVELDYYNQEVVFNHFNIRSGFWQPGWPGSRLWAEERTIVAAEQTARVQLTGQNQDFA
jgi:hypothetical protein